MTCIVQDSIKQHFTITFIFRRKITIFPTNCWISSHTLRKNRSRRILRGVKDFFSCWYENIQFYWIIIVDRIYFDISFIKTRLGQMNFKKKTKKLERVKIRQIIEHKVFSGDSIQYSVTRIESSWTDSIEYSVKKSDSSRARPI